MDTGHEHAGLSWGLSGSALVTVAEAARQLGLDARQVRRYAGRLADTDRTPEGQTPLRVRVSAVQALRDDWIKAQGQGTGQAGTPPGQSATRRSDTDTLIETLHAQIADLKRDKEKLTRDKTELYEALKRAQIIQSMPPQLKAPAVTPGDTQRGDSENQGLPGAEAKPAEKRGFWAWLTGR